MTTDLTRIYLGRHGEVAAAWRGRVYGSLDVPLSERGRAEARALAQRLAEEPLAAVVSSGLARAEFGAALLRDGRDLARRDEPELREIDRGAWAGRQLADLEREAPGAWARWHAAPDRERPPAGESLQDVDDRVTSRLQDLAREFAGAQLAVVCHSWVVRVAVCRALGLATTAAPRLAVGTGELIAIDWPVQTAVGESLRPTLVGFALDRPPARGSGWFRGPQRG